MKNWPGSESNMGITSDQFKTKQSLLHPSVYTYTR
jgi:hypothetical protein